MFLACLAKVQSHNDPLSIRQYPEKMEAAVRPVLELAKTYPEGSVMRTFLNSAEKFLKPL